MIVSHLRVPHWVPGDDHVTPRSQVEHVCEDYVVASSAILTGPAAKDLNRLNVRSRIQLTPSSPPPHPLLTPGGLHCHRT
eukprot:6817217-Pyramimonas_sp.AAC.1